MLQKAVPEDFVIAAFGQGFCHACSQGTDHGYGVAEKRGS
jgi:hypothetical protein